MAELNFGLINQNLPGEIANSVQRGREDAVREQMAKQQLLSSQQQTEKTGMEMEQFKRRQAGLDKFISVSAQNGKTGNPENLAQDFYNYAVTSGDPQLIHSAQQALIAVQERSRYNLEQGFGTPAPAAAAPSPATAPATAPVAAPVAAPNAAFGASTSKEPSLGYYNNLINMGANPVVAPSSNMLAPTPAPAAAPVLANNLATQAQTPADIQRRIIRLKTMYPGGAANTEIDLLTKQLNEMQKLHVVGENLVSGAGTEVYKGKPKPTQTGQLLAERDALLANGVPPNDPRIKAYSDRLAEGESQTAKLERELQYAMATGASPARIAQIRSDQRNLHPGLAMQNVVGVDASGNTSVTRFAGPGGGPTGTYVLQNQSPTGTARAMLGLNETDSALLFGPGGPVESGQIPVNKLNASNAKMYVAAIKANPTLNLATLTEDQLQNAAKAKAQGTVQGRQVLTLVDRSTAQNVANGNLPPPTGSNSAKIMNEVMAINPNYSPRDYGLQTSAVKAFNQGVQGNKVRSLNVVTEHFNTLEKAADALQSGDVRAINAVAQLIQTETGKPAPTTFNAVKEILADEIVASVVPGTGALADRVALKKTILAARSPEQLKGVVSGYKELIGGQLNGLEQQYKAGTNRTDFKTRYLTSGAIQSLTPATPAAANVDASNPLMQLKLK